MGYPVSLSIVRAPADPLGLQSLPDSLAWTFYRFGDDRHYIVDVFSEGANGAEPFSIFPTTRDLPLEFGAEASDLNALYAELLAKKRANSLRRGIVHLNTLLSMSLKTEVLTLVADDDDLDLASTSNCGSLQNLRFLSGGSEICWSPERGITRQATTSSLLHRIASDEAKKFLGRSVSDFPFGGEVTRLALSPIDSSPSRPLAPKRERPPRGGWAAAQRRAEVERTMKYRVLRAFNSIKAKLSRK